MAGFMGALFFGPSGAAALVYPPSIQYMVLAGGGAGGNASPGISGGGGGAGGYLTGNYTIPAQNINLELKVGCGGGMPQDATGPFNNPATAPVQPVRWPGHNSALSSPGLSCVEACGGGSGGMTLPYQPTDPQFIRVGGAGGSGGGAVLCNTIAGGANVPGQGFCGSCGQTSRQTGGGGGGAFEGNAPPPFRGIGGRGCNWCGYCQFIGTSGSFGAGGGGGSCGPQVACITPGGGFHTPTLPSPSSAGQGSGNQWPIGCAGLANFGGGGGGIGYSVSPNSWTRGGCGGSGRILIRYPDTYMDATILATGPGISPPAAYTYCCGGGYKCYDILTQVNFSFAPTSAEICYFMVGGGGGGGVGSCWVGNTTCAGVRAGGGGGGGGFRTGSMCVGRGVCYSVGVGAGGAGAPCNIPGLNGFSGNGGSSCIGAIIANGGGGGATTPQPAIGCACAYNCYSVAGAGGSGGGRNSAGSCAPGSTAGQPLYAGHHSGLGNYPPTPVSQGFRGGDCLCAGRAPVAGGGGGAAGIGAMSIPCIQPGIGMGGNGGLACAVPLWLTAGAPQYGEIGGGGGGGNCRGCPTFTPTQCACYAGGRGGYIIGLPFGSQIRAGTGGTGIAGSRPGGAAQAGFGSGGGGGGVGPCSCGGNGGSGRVGIRYPDTLPAATTTGSPICCTSGGFRIYMWTGSGSFIIPEA